MGLVDYASKALSVPSTLLVMWLTWLQIREIYRKQARRSRVNIRAGAIVKHTFSLSQNVGIWLVAAALFVGLGFVNTGLWHGEYFLAFVGGNFIIIATLLTFHIHWKRRDAERQYLSKYMKEQAARENKKSSKRSSASSAVPRRNR
jgi:hypothetical protein